MMLQEKIIDIFTGLAVEAAKLHYTNIKEEICLRDNIKKYLEECYKNNYMSSWDEEIDFGGLVDYIKQNDLRAIVDRVFSTNVKKKKRHVPKL